MPDTCGPTSPEQLTCFDLESASSKTSKGTSVKAESKSWDRLPQWGTASGGVWCELPTPARLTAVRGSSSSPLIGTPTAQSSATGRSDGPVYDPTSGKAPNPAELAHLLPTPVADNSRGLPSKGTDYASLANAAASLLPTPAVNDMGRGKTPEQWDDWTERMKAKHGNGNGHGKSLDIEAQRLLPTPTSRDHKDGASSGADVPVNALLGRTVWALAPTRQPYDGGNAPSEDQHPNPQSPHVGTGDTDSTHSSWNG